MGDSKPLIYRHSALVKAVPMSFESSKTAGLHEAQWQNGKH